MHKNSWNNGFVAAPFNIWFQFEIATVDCIKQCDMQHNTSVYTK